jgi:hypothetical protein
MLCVKSNLAGWKWLQCLTNKRLQCDGDSDKLFAWFKDLLPADQEVRESERERKRAKESEREREREREGV